MAGPGTGASAHSCMASFTFLQSGKCPWRFRQGHQRGEMPFSWWAVCGCTPVNVGDFGWVRMELRPLRISNVGRNVFGWWNLPLVVSLCCPDNLQSPCLHSRWPEEGASWHSPRLGNDLQARLAALVGRRGRHGVERPGRARADLLRPPFGRGASGVPLRPGLGRRISLRPPFGRGSRGEGGGLRCLAQREAGGRSVDRSPPPPPPASISLKENCLPCGKGVRRVGREAQPSRGRRSGPIWQERGRRALAAWRFCPLRPLGGGPWMIGWGALPL
jgi:hypothetical protein